MPDSLIVSLTSAVAYLVGYFLGYFLGKSRRRHSAEDIEVVKSSLEELTSAAVALAEMNDQLQRDFAEEKDRRESIQAAAHGLASSRDEWRELYNQHSIEHGNAQALLLTELHRVYAIAVRHKVPIRVDPKIQAVVTDYYDAHVEPSKQSRPDIPSVPLPSPAPAPKE